MPVLTLAETDLQNLCALLARYGLQLATVADGEDIPGSHWGESEAGLIGNRLYARRDTPLHSMLHEASHYVCLAPARRAGLHTDAGGDDLEENGVCYLQILLAEQLPGFGEARMFTDMDDWGYSFRLGSAQRWFEEDADDARAWLIAQHLIDINAQPTWRLRE